LPPVTRKDAAEGSQEGAVGPSVPEATVKLALQDPDLVTKHDKFDVLVSFAAPGHSRERQGPAQPEVQEREGHGP
jgi:hypothetical protein